MVTVASGLGALEAIDAGRKMGLTLSAILQVTNSGSGRNYMTRTILPSFLEGKYSFGVSVSEILADLNLAMALGMRCAAPYEPVGKGPLAANDLPSLARDCEMIFLCLPSSDVVREVLFGREGLAQTLSPGSIIVDQTTGDPHEARTIAEELEKLGVSFVDAPVSGGPEAATAGTTTIVCGGPEDA